MPYETHYYDVQKTGELGYDPIPIHRPNFIYFEFTGLRPSVPHWIFFGGIEVTKFCNTSYSKSDYESAARTSVLKEPGEQFINATEFPTGGGLPYGGATAAGGPTAPLYSNANGILSGVFYLQSNTTYNWNLSVDGTELLAIDVSNANRDNAYSVGAGVFRGIGQYENYYNYTVQQSYEVWVEPEITIVIDDNSTTTEVDTNDTDTIEVVTENVTDDKVTMTHTTNDDGGTDIAFDFGNDDVITHHYDDDGGFSVSDNSGGTWKQNDGGYWTRTFN